MRDIKFRVWDSISKTMHEWDKIKNIHLIDFITLDHYDLMQYTGLKDKEGKEIYEGDIVKYRGGRKVNGSRGFIKSEVIYNKTMFTVKDNKSLINDDSVLGICHVVGNIYENPELL